MRKQYSWFRICLYGWIIAAAMPAALHAQVNASAQLSANQIMIGDQVILKLNADFDSEAQVKGFDLSPLDSLKGIEVLSVKPAVSPAAGFLEQELTITAFDSGTFTLVPLILRYERGGLADSVLTGPLQLNVRTIPIQSDSTALQPIKGIIQEPRSLRDYLPYVITLGAIAILAILITWLIKRPRKKAPAPPPPPPVPPHEIALKKLSVLRQAGYWERGELKTYYSELTYILREYLEGRFLLKALESTTDEILRDIKPLKWSEERSAAIYGLLRTADLVKFAKATPPADSHAPHLENIEALVQATQVLPPSPLQNPGQDHAAN